MLLVGTADGLLDLSIDGRELRRTMPGANVVGVAGDWAIADGWVVALDAGAAMSLPGGLTPRCITALDGGRALVGTGDAHLVEVGGPDGPVRYALFDAIPTRSGWTTPWGGPPDTRSIAIGPAGLFAGVHVGGVWRREAAGWIEVVPAEADNHHVVTEGDRVAVAAAVGVGQSDDGGDTWTWSHEGLHASYCRAAAIAEGWLLATASTGPATTEGAVYRRPLADPEAPFTRCGGPGDDDLPAAFGHNVDTFSLAAAGGLVAVGTPTGELYVSEDSGERWHRLPTALPGVHCVSWSP